MDILSNAYISTHFESHGTNANAAMLEAYEFGVCKTIFEKLWAHYPGYDWKIRADKPLLKYGSFLMKPIFSANHRWAMAKGEESLKLELARRHARTTEERAAIPAPPPPTTSSPVPMLATTAAGMGLIVLGARRLARR